MAITLTGGAALTSGSVAAGNTSATSASISPGSNKLILVVVDNASFGTAGTIAVAGNSLTYVEEKTVTYSGGASRLSVFRAMGATPSAGTLSITNLSSNGAHWAVFEFDGVDTSGTNGSGAIVQSVSNTTTGADPNSLTVTLSALADATNNAVFAAFSVGSDALQTAGSGYTELTDDDSLGGSESIGLQTQWKLPGTTTPNASGQPAFADIAGIGIELKAAASSVTGTIAVTLANFTSAISGTSTHSGTIAVTLAAHTSAISGAKSHLGTLAVTLANFTSAIAAAKSHVGTMAVTLADFTSAIAGEVEGAVAAGRWLLRQIGAKTAMACRYLVSCVRRNRNNG